MDRENGAIAIADASTTSTGDRRANEADTTSQTREHRWASSSLDQPAHLSQTIDASASSLPHVVRVPWPRGEMKVSSTFYCQILNPIQAARRHPAGDGENSLVVRNTKSQHATDVKEEEESKSMKFTSRQTLIQLLWNWKNNGLIKIIIYGERFITAKFIYSCRAKSRILGRYI
jgi:hypothetical protein